jgi:hypothetical protein
MESLIEDVKVACGPSLECGESFVDYFVVSEWKFMKISSRKKPIRYCLAKVIGRFYLLHAG